MPTRVIRGSLWGLAGQATTLLVSFVATPFIIRKLGTEYYGLLTFILLLIGYLAFADLGMGIASTKFGAEAHSRGDADGESAVIWTSLLVAALPAMLVVSVLIFAGHLVVVHLFRIPVHLQKDAVTAVRVGAVYLMAGAISGIANTPQLVRLRIDLNTRIATGGTIVQTGLILLALYLGGKVVAVLAVMAGVAVATALSHMIVSSRLSPRMHKPQFKRNLVAPLIRFGMGLLAMAVVGTVIVHGEKFILVSFSSVKALAYYNVAFTLAGLLGTLPTAISQPLMPTFVHLSAATDQGPLERLYNVVLRGVIFCIAPAALVLCVIAKTFFSLWAGPDFGRESVLPLYLLLVGWLFHGASYVPRNLLSAKGELGLIARYQAAELVPYFLAALFLIYRFGIVGAALAWSLRVIVECLLLFNGVQRVTGVQARPFGSKRGAYALALVVLVMPILLAWIASPPQVVLYGVSSVSIAAYATLVLTQLLNGEEKAWIEARLLKFRR